MMKEKVIAWFDKINPVFDKLGTNIYLQSLSAAMMATLGPVFLGSMSLLMVIFIGSGGKNIAFLQGFVPILMQVTNFTIGAMAIYVVLLLAKNLVNKLIPGDDGISAAIIALMSFLIVTPAATAQIDGADVNVLPTTWLGAQGVFSAIIIGLLVGKIYAVIKNKGWTIKMPEGVPPMVSRVFEALIPTIVIGIGFIIIARVFLLTPFGSMHQMVYTIIQEPLNGLGGTIGAMIVISLLQQILWFFGIHGTNVIMPIMMPIWMALDMENLEAVSRGETPPNILGNAFFTTITWGGLALGLVMLMLFSKSKQYRELGKISIIPAIFGITEPVIFGTPLVLNFKLAFPFIFNNSIAIGLSYVLIKMGIVARFTGAATVFGLPVGAFAAIQGKGSIIVLMLIIQLILGPLLWYPWFKWAEKDAVKKELEGA